MTQLSFPCHVGIDVSKDKLDVWLLPNNQHLQVANSLKGVNKLIKHLPQTSKVVLEATGGYERLSARSLAKHGHQVCVANPKPIYHYRQSLNFAAKNDKIDARVIAQYANEMTHLRYGLVDDEQLELNDHESLRETLRKEITQAKNRKSNAHNPDVKKIYQQQIALLEKQLKKVDAFLLKKIKASPQKEKLFNQVQTIPGVGPKIATTLICQLPELGKLEHKPLARLVGVAPMANDSGKHCGKRFIQGGRCNVRNALYMGALVSSQCDPDMSKYYQSQLAKGKAKKSALVACMGRLLRVLNSVAKHEKNFSSLEKEETPIVELNYGTGGNADDREIM
jgi:transposase